MDVDWFIWILLLFIKKLKQISKDIQELQLVHLGGHVELKNTYVQKKDRKNNGGEALLLTKFLENVHSRVPGVPLQTYSWNYNVIARDYN